jgi:hypothetical protein
VPSPPALLIVATEISPTTVKVGDTFDVKITVRNISDKPLQSVGPEPGYTYVEGQTYSTKKFDFVPGKWWVGVTMMGLDCAQLPYRWGLGGDLAPGATTTINGHIQVTQNFQSTQVSSGLQNGGTQEGGGGAYVALVPALSDTAAVPTSDTAWVSVDAANVRSSPSVAASVLQQVKYGTQLRIIGQNADWFRVRLSDQSQGWVAAGWIITSSQPQPRHCS